jgi:hypothetical protein
MLVSSISVCYLRLCDTPECRVTQAGRPKSKLAVKSTRLLKGVLSMEWLGSQLPGSPMYFSARALSRAPASLDAYKTA